MLLFLDCYDSFTYNLASLVRVATGQEVTVCHHDALTPQELREALKSVEGVIVGPGPGSPANPADHGTLPILWEAESATVPVLGVCFGYQSMVLAHGGRIEQLAHPVHGQISSVKHSGHRIFSNIPSPFDCVRYHSLHMTLDSTTPSLAVTCDDGVEMAAQIPGKPWYGVQHHPESILSTYGAQLVRNWWELAKEFNADRKIGKFSLPRSIRQKLMPEPLLNESDMRLANCTNSVKKVDRIDLLRVGDSLKGACKEFVLLASAAPPGEWSVLGFVEPRQTWHIRTEGDVVYEGPFGSNPVNQSKDKGVFKVMAEYMAPRMTVSDEELPFTGGFIGYASYEVACRKPGRSSFLFIEKAIVTGPDFSYLIGGAEVPELCPEPKIELSVPRVTLPNESIYKKNIALCDEYLHAGDSYELCLTAETQIHFPKQPNTWELFRQLVKRNPAPYCTYMTFDDSLVGTSPERFMNWSAKSGYCQFRPIKGTVSKRGNIDRTAAEAILQTAKERGENLMIVDLIRHDLAHLLGDKVTATQIMQVEEYATVFQLVSVIEGALRGSDYKGVDVLVESLPPGSMTGAPKIRSVELLSRLEQRERGLYSGVAGYWSTSDSGDWSVIIRSLFKYKGEDVWRAGAGGAITVLSTPDGEWDEMLTKLDSVLKPLGVK